MIPQCSDYNFSSFIKLENLHCIVNTIYRSRELAERASSLHILPLAYVDHFAIHKMPFHSHHKPKKTTRAEEEVRLASIQARQAELRTLLAAYEEIKAITDRLATVAAECQQEKASKESKDVLIVRR